MPRRPRFEIPGVPAHVVQRGNNRAATFRDDEDRHQYLRLALRYSHCRGVKVHAYVLMGNHVHFLLGAEAPAAISRFMHDLGSAYVGWHNHRHGRTGTLWEGRFRSCLVDTHSHLWNCHRYIEFNPVRAGLCVHPIEYAWSSHAANARGRHDPLVIPRAEYLALAPTIAERCIAYEHAISLAASCEESAFSRLRNEPCLGSDAFVADVQARTGCQPKRKRGRRAIENSRCEPQPLPLFAS